MLTPQIPEPIMTIEYRPVQDLATRLYNIARRIESWTGDDTNLKEAQLLISARNHIQHAIEDLISFAKSDPT